MGANIYSKAGLQNTLPGLRAERKKSKPTSPTAGSPPQIGETTEMRERRKKQNRLAQQAFRGRQKVRVDSLESEWQQLRTLHEGLNQAYAQRTKEVEQLQKRVEQLLQDIDFLRSSQEVETWWPSSPSATSSPSSWTSSPKQQYTPQQTDPYPTSGFDMQQFFGEDGFSQYADFSLSSNLYETY